MERLGPLRRLWVALSSRRSARMGIGAGWRMREKDLRAPSVGPLRSRVRGREFLDEALRREAAFPKWKVLWL